MGNTHIRGLHCTQCSHHSVGICVDAIQQTASVTSTQSGELILHHHLREHPYANKSTANLLCLAYMMIMMTIHKVEDHARQGAKLSLLSCVMVLIDFTGIDVTHFPPVLPSASC